jgi:putative two-component system response regulator
MSKQGRVLAIDDNATNLAMIEEALRENFNLRLVEDSEEAVSVAARFLPDVILLDAMMPNVDGYEVCDRLRKHPVLKYSQIIMVSAKSELNDRLLGYHVGVDDYLTKPFDEVELYAKVSAALRNKHDRDHAITQLDASQTSAVEVLTKLMLMRRAESKEHTDRMRIYSLLLASELHRGTWKGTIDEHFVEGLYLACGLYDIGKLALPDLMLRERDPHTGVEFSRLRQHTRHGEELLNMLVIPNAVGGYIKAAAEAARSHHEKFDGSGYPDGLQEEQIPRVARIIAVADMFDSLTSGYMGAAKLSPISARDTISCGRGSKFDPDIVDAFLNVYDEFAEVCESDDFAENREMAAGCLIGTEG